VSADDRSSSRAFTLKLVLALRHPTREFAAIAAEVLGWRQDPRTIPALTWAIKRRRDSLVRSSAVRALALFDDDRAQGVVLECCSDGDAFVRSTARDISGH